MTNTSKALFLSTRPKTLLVGVAPIILGIGISKLHLEELNVPILIITFACTILMQIGTDFVYPVAEYPTTKSCE